MNVVEYMTWYGLAVFSVAVSLPMLAGAVGYAFDRDWRYCLGSLGCVFAEWFVAVVCILATLGVVQ